MSITERLDEIERVANAATEGPWVAAPDVHQGDHRDGPNCHSVRTQAPRRVGAQTIALTDYDEMGAGDATFIAAARTTVPTLVAALRAVLAVHQIVPTYELAITCGCDQGAPTYDDRHPESEDGEPMCLDTPGDPICATCGCTPGDWFEPAPHPCPTVRAIETALGGAA